VYVYVAFFNYQRNGDVTYFVKRTRDRGTLFTGGYREKSSDFPDGRAQSSQSVRNCPFELRRLQYSDVT